MPEGDYILVVVQLVPFLFPATPLLSEPSILVFLVLFCNSLYFISFFLLSSCQSMLAKLKDVH